jgi:hypothetical protein
MARVVVRGGRNWGVGLGPIGALFLFVGLVLFWTLVVVLGAAMVVGWAVWQLALAIERRRMRRRHA